MIDCCICGCGPAGAMLGLLLARAGLKVTVLEKHGDFLRDFRGDTIHPSTLMILDELGLADRFLALPHSEVRQLKMMLPNQTATFDIGAAGGKFPFIAFVPQWDFLDFITAEAKRYSGFTLELNATVTGVIEENGAVVGARYEHAGARHELRARLTVGADGRGSVTRAGLPLLESAAPLDVLLLRLSRRKEEGEGAELRFGAGRIGLRFNRGDFWQIAFVIAKGEDANVRARGLDAFRASVSALMPELADRVGELKSWDQVKLLTVRSDRLTRWHRPGYVAIGDAAHAMSPIGGVGINLAVQDAVTAANIVWQPLKENRLEERTLARVQRQRQLATRVIQGFQRTLQDSVVGPALTENFKPPLPMRVMFSVPALQRIPARLMAYGLGRPHVPPAAPR
jgi:2-polyprenyl-6-methoxyphenol hydroxylase-like FAD-dependent oxidoreductase